MATVNIPGGPPNYKGLLKGLVPIVIIGALLLSAKSFLYTLNPEEVGVVKRLGKYVRTTGPGLHVKLPWAIETVRKVRVKHRFKEEFGFRTKKAGVRTEYHTQNSYDSRKSLYNLSNYLRKTGIGSENRFSAESFMLTGDLNAAQVEWVVQYEVKDPVKYAFRVRDMVGTIRNMSEAVMREVVGDATVDEVLTYGKDQVEEFAEERLQKLLDKLDTGVKVVGIVLQDVNPPAAVKDSFNEVNEAKQDKERFVNQAWQEYNRAIPAAKGEAEKMIRSAEGYALQRVNNAKGDADRFLATWEEYTKAKDVTRRRLYLETMKDILPRIDKKIIMDSKESGVLPLLNLTQKEAGNE